MRLYIILDAIMLVQLAYGTGLSSLSASFSPTTAGATAEYTISFTPSVSIPTASTVRLTFPSTITLPSSSSISCSFTSGYLSAGVCSVNGNMITISGGIPSTSLGVLFVVRVPNIVNPPTPEATTPIRINIRNVNTNVATDNSNSNMIIQATARNLSDASIMPGSNMIGESTIWTFNITPASTIKTGSTIEVTFPYWNANIPNVDNYIDMIDGIPVCSGVTNINSALTCSYNASTRKLTVTNGFTRDRTGLFTFTIAKVKNPPNSDTITPFDVQIILNDIIFEKYDSSTNTLQVKVTTPNTIAGSVVYAGSTEIYQSTFITIDATLTNPVYSTCTMDIIIPSEISALGTLILSNLYGLNDSFSYAISGQTISITNCFTSSTTNISLRIENITNPQSTKPTSTFTIITRQPSGSIIDQSSLNGLTPTPGRIMQDDLIPYVSLLDSKVNSVTTYIFTFIMTYSVPNTGVIVIVFPNQINVTARSSSTGCLSPITGLSINTKCQVVGQTLTILNGFSNFSGGRVSFRLDQVRNPISSKTTDSFTITSYEDSTLLYKIDTSSDSITITAESTTLESVSVASSSPRTGEVSTFTFTILPASPIPIDGYIIIELPSKVTITDTTTVSYSCVGVSNIEGTLKCVCTTTSVRLNDGFKIAQYQTSFGAIVVTVPSIVNPPSTKIHQSFSVTIYDKDNYIINQSRSGISIQPTEANSLRAATVSIASIVNGALTAYIFSFTTFNEVDANFKVVISTPSEVTMPTTPSCSGIAGMLFISCTENSNNIEATLTLPAAVSGSTSFSFSISNVKNPPSTAPSSTFKIYTKTTEGYDIDKYDSSLTVQTTTAATIRDITISASSTAIGAITDYLISYTPENNHPIGTTLFITVPTELTFFFISCTSAVLSSSLTCSSSGNTVTLSQGFSSEITAPNKITFSLIGIQNPASTITSSAWLIESKIGSALIDINSHKTTTFTCISPCKTCINTGDFCTSCDTTSSFPYLYDNKCNAACKIDEVDDITTAEKVCVKCNIPCLTCSSTPSNCESCQIGGPTPYKYNGTCNANCLENEWGDGSECYSCKNPCLTCSSDTACTSCTALTSNPNIGSLTYLYQASCLVECPEGLLENSTTLRCDQCSSTCKDCSGTLNTCISCATGKFLKGTECVDSCPNDGTYITTTDSCLPCVSPCTTCLNTVNTCTSCISGKLLYMNECIDSCPSGTVNINNICQDCTESCATCSVATNICTTCKDNKLLKVNSCVDDCGSGWVQVGTSCSRCSGCLTCVDTITTCTSCSTGMFLLNEACVDSCPVDIYIGLNGQCLECEYPCASCEGTVTHCKTCEAGKKLYNGRCLDSCGNGAVDINNICYDCIGNCASCITDTSTCTTCKTSFYLEETSCVDACSFGYTLIGNKCEKCDTACLSCAGTTSTCTSCAPDSYLYSKTCVSACPEYYMPVSGVCQAIPEPDCNTGCTIPMLYNNSCDPECNILACNYDNGNCNTGPTICPDGQYQTDNTCYQCSSNCNTCNSATLCISCKDSEITGRIQVLYEGVCYDLCPVGTLKNGVICEACNSTCKTCQDTKDTCTSCIDDLLFYNNQCIHSCSLGTTIQVGNTCIDCSDNCDTCLGTMSSCTSCVSGKVLYNNECLATCPDGFTTITGSNSCMACDSTCLTCKDTISNCLSCLDDKYFYQNSCFSSCPLGTYSIGSVCTECPSSCIACSDYNTCSSCGDGYVKYTTLCLNTCPAGYQSNNGVCEVIPLDPECTAGCTSAMLNNGVCDAVCNISICNSDSQDCAPTGICPSGEYFNGSTCAICEDPCKTCDAATSCTSCLFVESGEYAGRNMLLYNNNCYYTCPSGTLQSGIICEACVGCKECAGGTSTCTACESNQFLYNGQCLTQCPADITVVVGSICIPCINSCATCSNLFDLCTSCPIGRVLMGTTCTESCPDGFTTTSSNPSICTACQGDCATCSGTTLTCNSCKNSMKLYMNTCISTCPVDITVEKDSNCLTCESPCVKCSGEVSNCTSCQDGLYLFDRICLPYCPYGYQVGSENICEGIESEIASFTLNRIQGEVTDSKNNFKMVTGTSSAFYPDYELDDPKASYDRGYYFDGTQSYMTLFPSILLPPSFSVSFWLNLESSTFQSLISKSDNADTPSLILSIYNLSPRIDITISSSSILNNAYHTFPTTLSLHTWHHLVYSINYMNGISELLVYLDTVQFSYILGRGYYSDSLSNQYLLAHGNSIAGFYKGFIYSMSVFNYAVDRSSVEGMVITECSGGCSMCPGGECLSVCKFGEYEDGGTCYMCPDRCQNGCLNSDKCNLCEDQLCKICSDYDRDSCSGCVENARFDSENRCECVPGYYWDVDRERCSVCDSSCETCSGEGIDKCILCNQGFYKDTLNICVETCPINYLPDTTNRVCTAKSLPGLVLSYKFNQLTDTHTDLASGVSIEFGSSNGSFPNYDENDPYIIPDKGLYISSMKYATISNISLGSSFSLQLWVKLTLPTTEEIFLNKSDPIPTTSVLQLYLTPYNTYKVSFLLTHKSTGLTRNITLETARKSLRSLQSSSEWNRVVLVLSYTSSSTSASIILNKDQPVTSTLANHYFKDSISYSIILGNKNPLSTFRGFIQSLKVYNTARSYDEVILDFPSDCSCSSCTEDGCISSCDINQADVNGVCLSCLSTCNYGCLRTTDCSLNEDMLCEEYTGSKYTDCISCVKFASKTETGCKCPENSVFEVVKRECVCNKNYWMKDNECIYCDRWLQASEVTAYFDEFYLNIIYDFAVELDTTGLECDKIFKTDTLAKLGSGYECEFVDNRQLKILLGIGTTILEEDTTIINQGILKTTKPQCNYPKLELTVKVNYIYSYPVPKAQFDKINNHYIDCGDLSLSGSKSSGGLFRPLSYKWTIVSDPDIPSISKYSFSDYSPQAVLLIPAQDLQPSTLSITLSIKNFLGMESSLTQSTSIYNGKGISVLFDSLVSAPLFRYETRSYSPQPVAECEISNLLEYSWSFLGISGNFTELDVDYLMSSQKNSKIFVVPPDTLPGGSIVKIRVNMEDVETKLSGYGEFEIPVLIAAPVVGFNVSSGDIGSEQDIVVSGDYTYDPDDIELFEYNWSCRFDEGDCTEYILDTTSNVLEVKQDALKIGIEYELLLEVVKALDTDINAGRNLLTAEIIAQRSIKLLVREGIVPVTNIVMFGDNPTIPTYISTTQQLQLQHVIPKDEGFYTFRWSKTSGGRVEYSSPLDSNMLVIKPGSMEGGMKYTFEVALNDGKSTYRYRVDIDTNSPPKYGKLVSNPTSGHEYSTIFELAGIEWVDEDNHYPLQYEFGFVAAGEDMTLNSKNITYIYYTQLPYISNPTTIFLQVYDALESFTRAEISVNLQLSENFDVQTVIDSFSEQLQDPRTSPLELIGIANMLAVSSINRDFYLTGEYPPKSEVDISVINQAFNLAIDSLSSMLSSTDFQSAQILSASTSLLNSLTSSPYLRNDEYSRTTVLELLKSITDLAYKNGVLEDQLVNSILSTDEQSITLDSESIYSNQTALSSLVSNSEYTIGTKILTMAPSQIFEGSTYFREYLVFITSTEALSGMEISLENSSTGVKFSETFSQDFSVTYPDVGEVGVLLMDINIIPVNQTEPNPSVVVISLFDTSSEVSERYEVNVKDPVEIIIGVKNITEDWKPSCAYLNETTMEWRTNGCELVDVREDSVVCECDHFTTFSVAEGIEEGQSTFEDSNIEMTGNVDALNDINWAENAIGLYFCIGILFIYILLGIISCKLDRNQTQKSLIDLRNESNFQSIKTLHTDRIQSSNIILSQEVNPKVNFNSSSEINLSASDERLNYLSDSTSHNLAEASKSQIKDEWWKTLKKKHEILSLIYHTDRSITRFTKLTLIVVNFLGCMFFIGMFYDSNENFEENAEFTTFEESILELSWRDFWVIIASNSIMMIFTIVLEKLLQIRPVNIEDSPDKLSKIVKRNKRIKHVGYGISFILIGYFVWSIVLYSIQFNLKASNLWIMITSLSFLWDMMIGQTYKIAIKIYLLIIILRWINKITRKRSKKDLTISESIIVSSETNRSIVKMNKDSEYANYSFSADNSELRANESIFMTTYSDNIRKRRHGRKHQSSLKHDKIEVYIGDNSFEKSYDLDRDLVQNLDQRDHSQEVQVNIADEEGNHYNIYRDVIRIIEVGDEREENERKRSIEIIQIQVSEHSDLVNIEEKQVEQLPMKADQAEAQIGTKQDTRDII